MAIVATFYKFVALPDYASLQQSLIDVCQAEDVKGTILLASEGINGTVSGDRKSVDSVLNFIKSDQRLTDVDIKESSASKAPFGRLKVRLKKEIVTIGLPEVSPTQAVGTYVLPKDWNQIISDPAVTVIDARNDYEVSMGSFQRAENPETQSFRDFPEYAQENLDPAQAKEGCDVLHGRHSLRKSIVLLAFSRI